MSKCTELLLRQSTPKDDLAIGEILVRSFVETYAQKMPEVVVYDERKAELRNIEAKRKWGQVWVLEGQGEIAGTFSLSFPNPKHPDSWIENSSILKHLALDLKFQGRGWSKLLLDQAIALAQSWNARAVCLTVRQGANGVARVYTRYGFKRDFRGDSTSAKVVLEGYSLECANPGSGEPSPLRR